MKNPIVKITDVEYAFPGMDNILIKKFSESIYAGEVLGVIGRNGVGKSTLMRLLASMHQPLNGNIIAHEIDSLDFTQRREYLINFCYLAHDKLLQGDYTLEEYFHLYSPLYPNYNKEIEESLMKRFQFNYQNRISSFSTGNKMKAFLLFAIASSVPIILVDEITAVLDPENREEFFELVKLYSQKGTTFVIATNLVEDLNNLANRVWLIDNGHIVATVPENLKSHFQKKAA